MPALLRGGADARPLHVGVALGPLLTAPREAAPATPGADTPPDGALILPAASWPVLPDNAHLALPAA